MRPGGSPTLDALPHSAKLGPALGDDAPPPLAAVDAVLLREVALAAQEAPPPAPPASDVAREVERLRGDHAAEVARLVEAHEIALDILREAHAAEVARMEATQRRVVETRHAGWERIRAGLAGARRWLVAVTSKRGCPPRSRRAWHRSWRLLGWSATELR